jgi:endonuclease/exonuclease/phosphatase family metal-dependent hydrolase
MSKGFDVVFDPIGLVFNTGNMILSRFPLRDPRSRIFAHHAGWQSMVPNGVLHATCQLPTGEPLHLFTTHLQCTTAPPAELRPPESPSAADSINAGVLDLLEKGEKVSGGKCDSVRKGQLHEVKAFMDSVIPTREDKFVLGGDLNIEGGSPEYVEMTRIFGLGSLCAPEFRPTYNTDSFLTPPGWRGVEYSVCLDHVLTNLDQVDTFAVLDDDLSDHRGLAVVVTPPTPALECPEATREAGPAAHTSPAAQHSTSSDSNNAPLCPPESALQCVGADEEALGRRAGPAPASQPSCGSDSASHRLPPPPAPSALHLEPAERRPAPRPTLEI